MARSDLILNLIRSRLTSDDMLFQHSLEALIADETAKQHHVFASQLKELLLNNSVHRNVKAHSNSSNIFKFKIPQKRLEDIILPDGLVTLTEEFIEEQLKSDLLRSYGVEPRHKILLYGPPGVGKTSLAEAIAEALSLPLYVLSYDSLISSFLGETSSRLAEAIDQIRAQKCIIFFDEFETLGKERSDSADVGEAKRVLSSLLLMLDSLPSHVILIGATNHSEMLDRASWRRFDTKMEFKLPTPSELTKWLNLFEARSSTDFKTNSKSVLNYFSGKSISELENFCMTCLRRYLVRKPELTFQKSVTNELKKLKASKTSSKSGRLAKGARK